MARGFVGPTPAEFIVTMTNTLLEENNFAFLPRKMVQEVTATYQADPSNESASGMVSYWNDCVPQTDEKGRAVYPQKKSLVSYFDAVTLERTSGPSTSIEHIDDTTVHGKGGSALRIHKAWPVESDDDAVLKSLRQLVSNIFATQFGTAEGFEMMQSAYRVVTRPAAKSSDPGPEGVHQDDADLTAIVLVNKDNVEGAENRVWTLDQPFGKASDVDTYGDDLIKSLALDHPLDMLLVSALLDCVSVSVFWCLCVCLSLSLSIRHT